MPSIWLFYLLFDLCTGVKFPFDFIISVFLVFNVNPPDFYLEQATLRLEHSLTLCEVAIDEEFDTILVQLGTFFNKFFLLPYFLKLQFYFISAFFVVLA